MKAGDTVQVQQFDGGAHWIYATVVTANADGSALVQIQHPGNREHGGLASFAAGRIRDKAAVQALIDKMDKPTGAELQEKRSLQSQVEALS